MLPKSDRPQGLAKARDKACTLVGECAGPNGVGKGVGDVVGADGERVDKAPDEAPSNQARVQAWDADLRTVVGLGRDDRGSCREEGNG